MGEFGGLARTDRDPTFEYLDESMTIGDSLVVDAMSSSCGGVGALSKMDTSPGPIG